MGRRLKLLLLTLGLAGVLFAGPKVALLSDAREHSPAGNALRILQETLQHRKIPWRHVPDAGDRKPDETLLALNIAADGRPAESFSIRKSGGSGKPSIAVTGAGETGLAYGIFELLGQIESAPAQLDMYGAAAEVDRTPDVKTRSLAMSLYNRDLERDWFFSRDFWSQYFTLLAKSRLNQFTLIFGHQTSYFAPVFPFMIDVPGYERLRTPDYTADDRRKNLAALQMISELADEWGIRFVLGIWQQNANNYGRNLVQGLSYDDLFDYCPKALAILLGKCPHIRGVQFRMNSESGIQEDDQNRFFTGMAKAIHSVGRPIWTDFRAKGLRAETVASIQAVGFPTTISTKFWREHMGLPYHGTRIDPLDKQRSYRRYGYWDLLYQDRPYSVMYRLWSFGSQKILLWGNLDYTRRFAEATHLGDAVGFETFAPLSQKGFGNWTGGNWRIFADRELEYYRWEFERYWAYYLTFGLATYSPTPAQPVLDGEFRARFGETAAAMRAAYDAAGWIIPFLTAVRNGSSSNFHYWPEMDTGGLTDHYIQLGTGDDNRFYKIDEYVTDTLEHRFSAKMTPLEMAGRLDKWAASIRVSLERAEPTLKENREFSASNVDFGVLAALAEYHSQRLRSAVAYQFFARTGERRYLLNAIAGYRRAVESWKAIVKLTDGVFYDHMVFNRPPEQIGHWKHELPLLQADLARLEQVDQVYLSACEKPEQALKWTVEMPRGKMTMQWKEDHGVLTRWADTRLTPDTASGEVDAYSMQNPKFVIRNLFTDFRYSKILHAPVRTAVAGEPLLIHASLLGPRKQAKLTLFYRYAGTGFQFVPLEMPEKEENVYAAAIPAGEPSGTIYYYIRAADQTEYFDGSAKEPHGVAVLPSAAKKPGIRHTDITQATVGKEVRVEATVDAPMKLGAVRFYYRHLDQSEDWHVQEMTALGTGRYQGVIPAEFVVPGWDVMYAIEAVDEAGRGSFYPDLDLRQPFVVTQVKSPGSH